MYSTGTGQVLASPAQEGQPGQPGQGPCTGALLSHPGQYLYCTRPISIDTGLILDRYRTGTGQPGSGTGGPASTGSAILAEPS
jgi:hypothetical protein